MQKKVVLLGLDVDGKKFRELLPLLTSRVLSLRTKGRVLMLVLEALFFMVVRLGLLRQMT